MAAYVVIADRFGRRVLIDAALLSTTTIIPALLYRKSTTAAGGGNRDFAFADTISTLITAFIGGQARLPGEVTVLSGGSGLHVEASVSAPEAGEEVTALFA